MAGNANFDVIASTTLKNYRPKLHDNIFKRVPLFMWLNEKGRKKTIDGGEKIVLPLAFTKNSTAKGYSKYDILDTTPQEEITAAEYVWAQYSASITISGREVNQNAGSKTRIINLLEAKTMVAEKSLREVMADDSADSTLDSESKLNGLQSLVDTTSTVGGINRAGAGNDFWQAQVTTSVGSFATNGLGAMRSLYNSCSDSGADTPDFGITTQAVFEYYEKTLQNSQRFTDTKVADGGFENLKFKGMTLMFDPYLASGELYMLNSNWIELDVHPDADLKITDFIRPADQDAKVAQILWMGNLAVSGPRRLGKLTGITA